MKSFLLFACCLFSYAIAFSQNGKVLHGKISYQDSYQKNIDVINFTTKKFTQTNNLGEFDIEAKTDDVLILMSESFVDQKYTVTAKDYQNGTLFIKLVDKPILLKEIEITQLKAIKAEMSQTDIKTARIQKDARMPRNKEVYTGEIENGMDFVMIGKMIGKLFKSKKVKVADKGAPLSFTDYAKANFDASLYTKTLKLKPDQTSRFLEYCEADPKSKMVIESNDELAILEFLMVKKAEFDKLK
ncbi:hypothetical protein [Flavobacterium wongokense]|uniref:hypothetical protein n=1 Tax=Flavobacterium wongokense TaxID=2910674 RepID=UPI001F3829CC|nr:hypothetical protein [Flavobacterium sp. WG47]MCF6131142.1 hypothetical protein [Flavobacterium sp. WG47]